MNPIITVVVPFYKTPKEALKKCINSILLQTFTAFELLLIDDGNTSDYVELVQNYCKQDKRIKLFSQTNKGVSSARNLGIENSSGHFISFIDSDDWVEKDFLKLMFEAIQNVDVSICGLEGQKYEVEDKEESYEEFFSKPSLYTGVQYINFCANKLFRLNIIQKEHIRFTEEVSMGEDALFLDKYLSFCNKIKCIHNNLYHYEYYAQSTMTQYKANFWEMEQKVMSLQWKMFHQFDLAFKEHQAITYWLYLKFRNVFYYYLNSGISFKEALVYLTDARKHKLFAVLIDNYKEYNRCFTVKDKLVFSFWRYLGVWGIIVPKSIGRVLKKKGSER